MTRAEIRKLAEANAEDELKARLGSRMSFGTAGNIVTTLSMLVRFYQQVFAPPWERGIVE